MKNFKIIFAIVLTAVFLLSTFSSASAVSSTFKRWEHERVVDNCTFANDWVDKSYDFSKIKKVCIPDIDISGIQGSRISTLRLEDANATYVKAMKCKLVDKTLADAVLEIKIQDWKSGIDHREPERITYEAYESYEGYEDVEREETRYVKDKKTGEMIRRKVKVHDRVWKVKSSSFPGSKRVITSDSRGGRASKITRSEPFEGSERVVHPEHDVYRSEVTLLFNLYDAKTGNLIMSRDGNVHSLAENYQMELYAGLCHAYFKDFRKLAKRTNKLKA